MISLQKAVNLKLDDDIALMPAASIDQDFERGALQ
jgi:hypothetical protein